MKIHKFREGDKAIFKPTERNDWVGMTEGKMYEIESTFFAGGPNDMEHFAVRLVENDDGTKRYAVYAKEFEYVPPTDYSDIKKAILDV